MREVVLTSCLALDAAQVSKRLVLLYLHESADSPGHDTPACLDHFTVSGGCSHTTSPRLFWKPCALSANLLPLWQRNLVLQTR